MKTNETIRPRRTVLASIASVAIALLGGCSDSLAQSPKTTNQSDVFERVAVEGEDLIIELSPESRIEQVTVIQPNGELFAKRSIAQGVTRETIRFGTNYEPGEYEVLGLEGDTTVERTSIEIRPDVRITDVKLARNHPEEMYEGASYLAIEAEAIVTVRNHGTGPEAITELRFEGDVPQPTPENLDKSGIYDVGSAVFHHADRINVPPTESRTLFSHLYPFSPSGENVRCEPSTVKGTIVVAVETQVNKKRESKRIGIEYTGTDLSECDINLLEGNF